MLQDDSQMTLHYQKYAIAAAGTLNLTKSHIAKPVHCFVPYGLIFKPNSRIMKTCCHYEIVTHTRTLTHTHTHTHAHITHTKYASTTS